MPKCQCCGYENHIAGVASCSAPISILWCSVCIGMGCEPADFWVWRKLDPKKTTDRAHFDRKTDRYYRGTEPLTIPLVNRETGDTLVEWEHRADVPDTLPTLEN